jgi:anti-anti-sigma regulatory factor
MLLLEVNKVRRLLHVSYIGHVRASDLRQSREELDLLLAELRPGFSLLVDLSHLESMDIACEDEIIRIMESLNRKGVGAVARVIPEPARDIGLNILTAFHYSRRVRVFTCQSLEEGLERLQQASAGVP